MFQKPIQVFICHLDKIRRLVPNTLDLIARYLSTKGFDALWLGGVPNIGLSRRYFEMALILAPDHVGAHAGLARVWRYYRQPKIALQHAANAEAGNPGDWHNLKVKALILRDVGRLSEAAETMRLAANLEPAGPERVVTVLTAQVIAAAAETRHDDGLSAIISTLSQLAADSWEPYRLAWWLLRHKGDRRASQLVGVGQFVLGVGNQYLPDKKEIISVSDLKEIGAVIDDRILSLNDTCDTSALDQNFPRWELLDQRSARITVLRGASCVSSKFGTAVLVGGRLVDELSQNDALMILARGVPDSRIIEGRVLNVAFPWGEGFFHFMMEILPSIGAAHEAIGASAFDKYLLGKRAHYQVEILARLGISEEKLIFSDQNPAILPREMAVITNLAPRPPFYEVQRWACYYVRGALSPIGKQGKVGSKRVYISRGVEANGRNVSNERQLSLILKRRGFVTIYPEELDFPDQVSLYQSAEVIVAPAGGALTNLIFCKPGTKVLILYQPHSTWRCYRSIAEIIGLEMCELFGDKVWMETMNDPDWMEIDDNVNFEVNLPKFEKILTLMLD